MVDRYLTNTALEHWKKCRDTSRQTGPLSSTDRGRSVPDLVTRRNTMKTFDETEGGHLRKVAAGWCGLVELSRLPAPPLEQRSTACPRQAATWKKIIGHEP